jgi:uncharacterized protein
VPLESRGINFPHRIQYKRFDFNGIHVIFDVLTVTPFEVEPIIVDIFHLGSLYNETVLRQILSKRYNPGEITNAIRHIEGLRAKGFFLAPNEITTSPLLRPQEISYGKFFLTLLYGCNLRCKYCYEKKITHGQKLIYMSKQMAKDAINFIISSCGDQKQITVCFWGGEPFLNFSTLEYALFYLLKQTKKRGIKPEIWVVTNATLLTPKIAIFIGKYFDNIVVNLDGTRKIHNFQRPFKDGKGSYNRTINGLKLLLKHAPDKVMLQAVITRINLELHQIYREFRKFAPNRIKFALCFYPQKRFDLTDKQIKRYFEEERRFIKDLSLKEFIRFKILPYMGIINTMRTGAFPLGCGAGRSLITIAPDGELYACSRALGIKEFKLGHIYKGIDKKRQERFINLTVDSFPDCHRCWARYLCRPCAHENLLLTGDLKRVLRKHCCIRKSYIEHAILLALRLFKDKGPNL